MTSSSHFPRFRLDLFTCFNPFMGCGVSKFEDRVGPTCDFKPVHQRNNTHATADSPIATKPSLEDGKKEDIVDFVANQGRRSMSLTRKDKMFLKKTNVQDMTAKDRGIKKEKEEVATDGDNKEGEEDSDEEEIGEDSICFPASPSFKEYCTYDSQDFKDAGIDDGDKSNNESQMEEFLNSDKESRTQSAKSRRKRRGIRNVLSKGGSSGVKNLLNVTRYSPINSNSHDNFQNQKMVGKER